MYLCDDHHEEIVYNERLCPVCEAQKEIERLQLECERLRDEIASLK